MKKKEQPIQIVEQRSRATVSGTLVGKVDAFSSIRDELKEYFVADYSHTSDGYIGIPVALYLYTKDGAYRRPIPRSESCRIDDEVEPNNHKLLEKKESFCTF